MGRGIVTARLYRLVPLPGVLHKIEGMAPSAPGPSLQKMAFYVDASGKLANPLEITPHIAARQIFSFDLEGGGEIDVCRNLVLPSLSEITLSPSTQQPTASESTRHRVEAFIAKKVDDRAPGELMCMPRGR